MIFLSLRAIIVVEIDVVPSALRKPSDAPSLGGAALLSRYGARALVIRSRPQVRVVCERLQSVRVIAREHSRMQDAGHRTHTRTRTHARTHMHTRTHTHTRMHSFAHAHTHTLVGRLGATRMHPRFD